MTLFDFSMSDAARAFVPINDVIMGGRSSSRIEATDAGTAVFCGTVSMENNGGFASVRSVRFNHDLGKFNGVVLDLRGDGRRYKVNLRTVGLGDQAAYQAVFDTLDGVWQTLELPFSRFEPKLRGRPVPGAPPIDQGGIVTLGLMIADRQEGDFRLELRSIRTLD